MSLDGLASAPFVVAAAVAVVVMIAGAVLAGIGFVGWLHAAWQKRRRDRSR